MRNPAQNFIPTAMAALFAGAAALSCPAFAADSVYKCVKDGKTSYYEKPPAEGQCQETPIRDDGPSPADLARMQEEKLRKQEEERREREADLKEREIRAKEIEAAAAARRARAEEAQILLQPEPQYVPYPTQGYFPYWGGGFGRPLPPPSPRPPMAPPRPPNIAPAGGGARSR